MNTRRVFVHRLRVGHLRRPMPSQLTVGAGKRIPCLLHHQSVDVTEQRRVQYIRLRFLLNPSLGFVNRGDDRPRCRPLSVGKPKLRVHGPQIARRSKVDMVCPEYEKRAGALCLVRHDHRQLSAVRLRLPLGNNKSIKTTRRHPYFSRMLGSGAAVSYQAACCADMVIEAPPALQRSRRKPARRVDCYQAFMEYIGETGK